MIKKHILYNRLQRFIKPFFDLTYRDQTIFTFKEDSPLKGLTWLKQKKYGTAFWRGAYETNVKKRFIDELKIDSIFWDIGAYCGYYSLLASGICKKGKVISFEPVPENYKACSELLKMNKDKDIAPWDVRQLAVGNKVGKTYFSYGSTKSTGHISGKGDIEVAITTVDSFIEENKIIPSHIKIDVEGYAYQVLEGAHKLLSLKSLPFLMIEIHNEEEATKTFIELKNKYDLFLMDGTPMPGINFKGQIIHLYAKHST